MAVNDRKRAGGIAPRALEQRQEIRSKLSSIWCWEKLYVLD